MNRIAPLLSLVLLGGVALGQTEIQDFPGVAFVPGTPAGLVGYSIARFGDLDGDGHDDVLLGCPAATPPSVGTTRVVSGRSGVTLAQWTSPVPAPGSRFGNAVAGLGDFNRDGTPDFLVGEPDWDGDRGRVLLISGRGPILAILSGQQPGDGVGGTVELAADMDGDGVEDILATNFRSGILFAPRSWTVFSGRTMQVLHRRVETGNVRVTAAGDVDGDGAGDLLVASTQESTPGGPPDQGILRVLSGTDLRVLAAMAGTGGSDLFGIAPGRVGDVNGDGREDIGAFGINSGYRVFSFSSGLQQVGPTYWPSYYPSYTHPTPDLDGDLVPDYMVVVDSSNTVEFVSGATNQMIADVFSSRPGFAGAAGWIGDVDADGRPDFAVGSPEAERNGGQPDVHVYTLGRRTLSTGTFRLSLAAGGSQDLRLDLGATRAGSAFAVLGTMSGVLPGTPIGPYHLPINVDPYTFSLLGGTSPVQPMFGTLDGQGRALARFVLPAGMPSGMESWTLHHACLALDATGSFETTDAVPLTFTR